MRRKIKSGRILLKIKGIEEEILEETEVRLNLGCAV